MQFLVNKTKAFFADESGAVAIEYGLLAALIAIVIAVSVQGLGTELKSVFENVKTKLGATGASGATGTTGTGTQ
ncbi:MAG: Flp family type IVb pilin [Oxalobacteraceae bacterium]|jgi:pilus assembly protein Flp/PilA|nr:Flp family type IVb pilin [Oxalobacteraceae bacterium]